MGMNRTSLCVEFRFRFTIFFQFRKFTAIIFAVLKIIQPKKSIIRIKPEDGLRLFHFSMAVGPGGTKYNLLREHKKSHKWDHLWDQTLCGTILDNYMSVVYNKIK